MLQKVSDYLLIHEAQNEIDEHEYSVDTLNWNWGRYTNYKMEDDGTEQYDIEEPYFTDLFYNSLKYVSRKENFIKELKEKAVFLKNKALYDFLEIYEKMGICSFSNTIKDIQMWAYYADNHKGFCIEYEVDQDEMKKNELILKKVIYKNKRPETIVTDKEIKREKFLKQICTKSHLWDHEKEVRMISFRTSNNLIKFPGKIKSVTFGINMPFHERTIITDLISSKDKEIKFYLARISNDIYTVHRTSLNDDLWEYLE